jgi:endo-1,3(4)-beta-glucanase
LNPESNQAFRYDLINGGLLTVHGILGNPDEEHGHEKYNNHHTHHGYFIYAAAILARRRPSWWKTYRHAILALCMDYMYVPTNIHGQRAPFPRLRHFDPYDGHSWANGFSIISDNTNQQNISESVHAYYAAALLGQIDNRPKLRSAALALLSMELRSVQTYWQTAPPPAHPAVPEDGVRFVADTSSPDTTDSRSYDLAVWEEQSTQLEMCAVSTHNKLQNKPVIYPAPFRYCGTAGLLWPTKANHTTWFSDRPECIHGIHMLPFQPISIAILSPIWIQRIWPLLEQIIRSNTHSIWRTILAMAGAVRDVEQAAQKAWTTLSQIPPGTENDELKTIALYWTAANMILYAKRHTSTL